MNPTPSPSRLVYGLLAVMTIFTFGGPFVLMLVIRGGEDSKWPPDRPIEWFALISIVSIVCLLVAAGLSIRWWLPGINVTEASAKKSTVAGRSER